MREKRAACSADSAATSAEAEAIFAAIEPRIADGATDNQKSLVAELGIAAVRLPHGQREATIEKLIALAPRRARCQLLLNLILSGAEIDSKFVTDGIAETFEAARNEPWILTQGDGYELREWLRLLPFTNRPSDALGVVRELPSALRRPDLLESMVDGLAETPSEGGEEVLFKLAEEDPRLYHSHGWRTAASKLGTVSAACRLIDLTADGAFDREPSYDWHWSRKLGALIAEIPEARRHVHHLLKDGVTPRSLTLLACAIAEKPDAEGILLLVDIEKEHKVSLFGRHAIESVVTEHVPSEEWRGAYDVVPVSTADLRRELLARTTDGGPTDAAARCLNTIDSIRDEYGRPLSEARHPDLASGKEWPIMMPDPDATAEG